MTPREQLDRCLARLVTAAIAGMGAAILVRDPLTDPATTNHLQITESPRS